ncbi:MOSC domain-containing protein [Candidatus Obscuribacterales bacterium]|nr:MOSC domain-containing protein [Candidatus Obscuribacterales bacterium]
MPRPKLYVKSLHFYPVKSCAGIDLQTAAIDTRGIKDDRGWLIVTEDNKFLTQRQIPKMALIQATITGDENSRALKLEASGIAPLTVPEFTSLEQNPKLSEREVTVWDDSGLKSIDQGDEAAEWLSGFLGSRVRLVRMSANGIRDVKGELPTAPQAVFAFQDGFPFLLISTASLQELNRRMEAPLPMNRFRPNIVIEGADAFAEDHWATIRIGDVTIECDKPCARCVITTIDQQTATKHSEPLKTLATFRKEDNQVMFGQNAIHLNQGTIRVNDEVEILKMKSS